MTTFSLLENFEISLPLVHSTFTLLPSIQIPFHSFLLSFKREISVLQCWCVSSLSTCVLSHLSRIRLFVTPSAVAHQASLSMGFSIQEYWSGLPCPSPGDLPDPVSMLGSFLKIFLRTSSSVISLFSFSGTPIGWLEPLTFLSFFVLFSTSLFFCPTFWVNSLT